MVSDWQTTTIGEQVTLQRGIDITKAQQRPGNIPVVSSGGISSFHDVAYVKGPGVVLGRKGTVGTVFYIPEDYWPHDTTLWVRDFHGNDPKFVYYFFRSISQTLASLDVGTANPALNRNHVHPIEVYWPSLPTQRAIARILGALDDKIDLNGRMNRTLEAMAQAVFKSWFVDFDPVTARAEGRQPFGMDAETAGLFPSAFQSETDQLIPQNWHGSKLASICSTQYGYTASAKPQAVGPKFLRITDINKEPWIEWSTVPYCEIPQSEKQKYQLSIGDILVSRMADPGKAGIIEEYVDAVFASYLVRLKVKNSAWSYFLFYFLRSDDYLAYADSVMSGSVQVGMNAKVIVDADVVLPTDEIVNAFYNVVYPFRKMISSNLQQSRTLAALRDTLLPRLLSGELTVQAAEEAVRETSESDS